MSTQVEVAARRSRVAACGAVLAAAIWGLVWLQQYHAHGRTSVNEMRLVVGLTWMDAAKILPLSLLLLLPGTEVVVRRGLRGGRRSRRGTVLGRSAQACLVVAAVAGAVDFWSFPLGSYAVTFESRGDDHLPLQFLGCVVAGLLLAALAVLRRRAPDAEGPVLLVLAAGTLTASLWTPVLIWPVLAWAGFGVWLWWSADCRGSDALMPGKTANH